MSVAPWLRCKGDEYTVLSILGGVSAMMYVLGVPFAFFILLRRLASKRDDLDEHERQQMDSWLGSIYLPYEKKFRSYAEVLFLLRRSLIASSLLFIPRENGFRALGVCSVLLAALCFQLVFRPFKSSLQRISLENTIESLVLLGLYSSCQIYMSQTQQTPHTTETDDGEKSGNFYLFVLFMNGAIVFVLCVSVITVFIVGCRRGAARASANAPNTTGAPTQGEETAGTVGENGGGSVDTPSESSPLLPESDTNAA